VQSPLEITVYDVVQPVDPIGRIPTCPLGLENHQQALCPLHAALDAAAAELENSFRSTTIAQLSEEAQPLCSEKGVAKTKRAQRI
jgi:DNA-binding IscR family transcriptional regulator